MSTIGFHKFGLMKHGNDYVDTLVNICYKSMRYSATDLVEEKIKEIIEEEKMFLNIPDSCCMCYSFVVFNAFRGHFPLKCIADNKKTKL